ncbi:MAG: hypothetical protein AAF446_02370, partial [Pseudomonadota bacterium]
SWNGACSGSAGCQITMDQPRNVGATFSGLQEFPLSVNVDGSGSVTSNPAGINCPGTCVSDFVDGSLVTLSASPEAGFELSSWNGACSGSAGCQITMDQPRNVGASFQLSSVSLTVRMKCLGNGRVTSTPAGIDCTSDCSASFAVGSVVNLTAIPNADNVFQNWTGACSGSANCSVTMNEANTIGVIWANDETIFIDGME